VVAPLFCTFFHSLWLMCSIGHRLIVWKHHAWSSSGHNNASHCASGRCFFLPFLWRTPEINYGKLLFCIAKQEVLPLCSYVYKVYLSASNAAMSSRLPFLHVYQWCPNWWHIGHWSCLLPVPSSLPDFFLLLPPSKADFILFFLLPPAVDLTNGGCMKKPWVGLGHCRAYTPGTHARKEEE
jgi:hypothetical protein